MVRVFALGLLLLCPLGCGESTSDASSSSARAQDLSLDPEVDEAEPSVAVAPRAEPGISLDRLLTPPADSEVDEAGTFRDYRDGPQRREAFPVGQQLPVPEWLEGEIIGGSLRNEVVGPGRTVESRELGASLGVVEDDIEVTIKGKVREDRSESFPEAEGRDRSIRLEITIPLEDD